MSSDLSPADVVTDAAHHCRSSAGLPERIARPLSDLLGNVADAMRDDDAEERHHPDNIPTARWLVHHGWDPHPRAARVDWTDALRLSRAVLGHPDPNTP